MKIFMKNYRVWWKKPADPTERNIHREISMLELFYDLIYVAIMMQLTHLVAGHISLGNVAIYISVFSMIIWAWFIGSLYHELHGNVDFKTRLIVFSQMLPLIGMGISIHNIHGEGYRMFAFFYGFFDIIQFLIFWRTGVHNKEQKEVITPYVRLFGISALLFFISMMTPANIAYFLWFVATFLTIVYMMVFMVRKDERNGNKRIKAIKDIGGSFVERLSLIVTILLGEGVTSIVEGGSHIKDWGIPEVLDILGCFLLLILIWLLYFDFISRRLPRNHNLAKAIWLGLHFPLIGSIGLTSAGLLNLVAHTESFHLSDKLMVIVPLAVFLLCYLGLIKSIQITEKFRPIFRNVYNKTWLTLLALVGIGIYPFTKTASLWLTILSLSLLFGSSFIMWVLLQIRSEKEEDS